MNYLSLKSGTDIRGVASEGVNGQEINLTDDVIENIAAGFLLWCENHLEKPASELKIAVGHDSRISADRIYAALERVFLRHGCHVLNCGLASTPSMFMAILEIPCDCSVEITASHHPFNRNGLKFFSGKNGGLESTDISEILSYVQETKAPVLSNSGKVEPCSFMKRYAEILRTKIKHEVSSDNYEKPLDGFHIVVDAGNGAGGFYASDVLEPLGANIDGSCFLEPDGMFPNHVPNPENAEAMKAISSAVLKSKADLGVIFDTDVDRGAAVDANGTEISRNRLVALAAAIALENVPGGTIVTDSITSDGLKIFIEQELGGIHHRFKRGYKNVINEALRLNKAGQECPLAIETSGHAAMRENYFLDDGAYLVTKIIIKMAQLKKEGKTIDNLLTHLEEAVEEKEIRLSILTEDFKSIGEKVIADLENYAKQQSWFIAPDSREGIRISFDKENGDGWFLLRLSVHDPIMPLNIESNQVGGTSLILSHLADFLKDYSDCLDISVLSK
ncbi:phosphomannomutase/phosphoglucomutase [Scatolibacter rhodanostii]|uniref:phosphomannomutase/phosphoglucomutase n=1 Tax=Scatolibacter rhodanostii TaxID=2014781 RepID=UPI000C085585|nr:phosphomannomutase/phosphoglucomutase [Scatolibacter rhodanostii]